MRELIDSLLAQCREVIRRLSEMIAVDEQRSEEGSRRMVDALKAAVSREPGKLIWMAGQFLSEEVVFKG
jgi:hypothetical protein